LNGARRWRAPGRAAALPYQVKAFAAIALASQPAQILPVLTFQRFNDRSYPVFADLNFSAASVRERTWSL